MQTGKWKVYCTSTGKSIHVSRKLNRNSCTTRRPVISGRIERLCCIFDDHVGIIECKLENGMLLYLSCREYIGKIDSQLLDAKKTYSIGLVEYSCNLFRCGTNNQGYVPVVVITIHPLIIQDLPPDI